MTIVESQQLKLPPEAIWPWLADPSRWPQWNRKVKEVRRSGTGLLKHGETFALVAALSRTQEMQAEVVRVKPGRRLVVRCRYEWRHRWRGVTEDWELIPQEGGTLVRHVSDLRGSGIPKVTQWLIWFIHRFGRPAGASPWSNLERLLKTKEQNAPA